MEAGDVHTRAVPTAHSVRVSSTYAAIMEVANDAPTMTALRVQSAPTFASSMEVVSDVHMRDV